MSIILVDDDQDIVYLIQRYLSWEGQEVDSVAHDMASAMALAEWPSATVAIVDYHLPDGNGEQLCEWIRAHYPDVTRILLTGRPDLVRGVEYAHYVFGKGDLRGKLFAEAIRESV